MNTPSVKQRATTPSLDTSEGRESLSRLSAAELTQVLCRHFESVGGLATETERALGRELVRRARRLEELERAW
jgi:hypothetical protein